MPVLCGIKRKVNPTSNWLPNEGTFRVVTCEQIVKRKWQYESRGSGAYCSKSKSILGQCIWTVKLHKHIQYIVSGVSPETSIVAKRRWRK